MSVPADLKTKRTEVASVSSKEMLVESLQNANEVSYTTSYILAVMAIIMGIYYDMVVSPSAFPYFGAILGTFLVSVLVNVYVSSKVKTIDMVEALKSRE